MPSRYLPAPSPRAARPLRAAHTLGVVVAIGIIGLACGSTAAAATLEKTLEKLAPQADSKVISMATQAMTCAVRKGEPKAKRLAIIDYSKPSTARRLWVFDLSKQKLLFHEWVAHGSATGDNRATYFTNKPGSHASSLGLFLTGSTYHGHNGLSLRLRGLEPGINNNAYKRAIVIHGASYATPAFIHRVGRLGRSWGCPAVRPAVAKPLIHSLKGGQYVFAYYPKPSWIKHSKFLHCGS